MEARRLDGGVRTQHSDVLLRSSHFQAGGTFVSHRLLDEVDAPVARQARHQLLRALEHEIPAQMGEDDEARQCHGHSGRSR